MMDDIFTQVREGNAFHVRVWLDNTENDLNKGDDHRFSLLHWASYAGHANIVEMLIHRGARVNATNMGDDTALHLAASHGHGDIVHMLLQNKANINAINEHGNTPLHYACFYAHESIAEELVNNGALVGLANRYNEAPIEKATSALARRLTERAQTMGQDLTKIPFKDCSWLGYKTRSRDATLSRHVGVEFHHLALTGRIASTHSGEVYRGAWQDNDITAKLLNMREVTVRNIRDFNEEIPRLRIFNHPNVLPVLAACTQPPDQPPRLIVLTQFMPFGSLYNVLHGETGIVVDQNQALRFAIDIARGMEFLHSMDPMVPNLHLTSKHIMIDEDLAKINIDDPKYTSRDAPINAIDEDLTARINMGDYKFSFHEKGKLYTPAWLAPEALTKKPSDINQRAADMWSFGIVLWELETREEPFADLSPMETGMKIAMEGLRVQIPPGIAAYMARLINICLNEEPGKRPRFDMILPILDKMKVSA